MHERTDIYPRALTVVTRGYTKAKMQHKHARASKWTGNSRRFVQQFPAPPLQSPDRQAGARVRPLSSGRREFRSRLLVTYAA